MFAEHSSDHKIYKRGICTRYHRKTFKITNSDLQATYKQPIALNTNRPIYLLRVIFTKRSLLCNFNMKSAMSSVILALLLSALGAAAPIEGSPVSDHIAFF
jgi:hypothetical protein